jgi:hypothetical protein
MMWRNIVEPDRPRGNRTLRIPFAFWMTEAKNTHPQFLIDSYFFSTATIVIRTRLIKLTYE